MALRADGRGYILALKGSKQESVGMRQAHLDHAARCREKHRLYSLSCEGVANPKGVEAFFPVASYSDTHCNGGDPKKHYLATEPFYGEGHKIRVSPQT